MRNSYITRNNKPKRNISKEYWKEIHKTYKKHEKTSVSLTFKQTANQNIKLYFVYQTGKHF